MGRHFLELTDAATLETEHYLLARRAVLDAVESCAMAVIHGSAGLGKTYAVDELVQEQGIRVLWTSFPSRPTTRAVAANLYELLAGRRTRLIASRSSAAWSSSSPTGPTPLWLMRASC